MDEWNNKFKGKTFVKAELQNPYINKKNNHHLFLNFMLQSHADLLKKKSRNQKK